MNQSKNLTEEQLKEEFANFNQKILEDIEAAKKFVEYVKAMKKQNENT